MLRKNVYKGKVSRLAKCQRHHDEVEPKPGLAYTPADMAKLHAQGMPINSANIINQFYDGEPNPSFDIPIERQRGLDPAEIWETSKASAKKIKEFEKVVKSKK